MGARTRFSPTGATRQFSSTVTETLLRHSAEAFSNATSPFYHGTEYVVVHLPVTTMPLDRQQAVDFADFCLNDRYGWLTIVSIALCLLTGAKFSFGVDGQQICSAQVARCIERIGEIFREGDPWHLAPADLAKHFKVLLTGKNGESQHPKSGVTRRLNAGWSAAISPFEIYQ